MGPIGQHLVCVPNSSWYLQTSLLDITQREHQVEHGDATR